MKFTLEIDCDNAAFVDSYSELPDILAKLRDRIRLDFNTAGYPLHDTEYPIRDSNGNRVGTASITFE